TANLDDETLNLENLALAFLGVNVNGSLQGRNLMSDLSLNGRVQIETFDPSALLETFDVAVDTADPEVLRQAAAEATFVYDANQMALQDMTLLLDDSELAGSVGMQNES